MRRLCCKIIVPREDTLPGDADMRRNRHDFGGRHGAATCGAAAPPRVVGTMIFASRRRYPQNYGPNPAKIPAWRDCIIPASMSGEQKDSILRRGISRRNFGQRAAWAGLATALNPSDLVAQGRGGNQTPLPPQDQAEVDAKFTDMVAKYGDRFTEDQKMRARGVLARHQRMLMRVREFPLENGDAPATELHLYPKGLKE